MLEERRGGPVERHQVVGRDCRTRVVEAAPVVGERERTQAERLGQPACPLVPSGILRRARAPGAVQLLGAPCRGQRLQRMHGEPSRVRVERSQRRPSRHVRDPRARLELTRDVGDRAVGHAEQAKLAVVAHGDAALAQTRGDRGAGAPGADDGDLVEHVGSSSGIRIPGIASVLQG